MATTKNQENAIMRATGLVIIEVINSNPNGDPDRESDPRQRPDKKGEISPVSFKRKIRDLVDIKEGPVWKEMSNKFTPPLNNDEFFILESRGRARKDIINEIKEEKFIKKYWDGRIFGNTFLEKEEGKQEDENETKKKIKSDDKVKNNIKTGVVQFGLGISVAPIQIERMTTTNKPGVQEGLDRGMAPLAYRIVYHGVYCMPFFVNPTAAVKTGCTLRDIQLLKYLIPYAYQQTASYIRPSVEIRHAWYIEHKSPLGSCSDFELLAALTPKRKKGEEDKPSQSWEDYQPEPKGLPDNLKSKIKSFEDLMNL